MEEKEVEERLDTLVNEYNLWVGLHHPGEKKQTVQTFKERFQAWWWENPGRQLTGQNTDPPRCLWNDRAKPTKIPSRTLLLFQPLWSKNKRSPDESEVEQALQRVSHHSAVHVHAKSPATQPVVN